jgi:hypothetical protein
LWRENALEMASPEPTMIRLHTTGFSTDMKNFLRTG